MAMPASHRRAARTRRRSLRAVKSDFTEWQIQAKAMRESWLTCRDFRHPWKLVGYYRPPDAIGVLARKSYCPRCGTHRLEFISQSTGEVTHRRYHYPEGFNFKGEAPSVSELRLHLMQNVEVLDDEPE